MRLAARLSNNAPTSIQKEEDPREGLSAEVIDLASRNSFPAVSGRKKGSDAIGLAAGVAVVALLGAVTLWGMNAARMEEPEVIKETSEKILPTPTPTTQPVKQQPIAIQPQKPAPQQDSRPIVNLAPKTNPYASPTVVFDASAMPVPDAAAPASPATGNSANDFASRIGGVGGGPARAARMFDTQTTVTQGTLIPAVLETAIDTDVPGFVRAVVSQDVRSYDGTRVLVPRSSRLIGQYQSGLQNGQKRAYVIWTRLIRPDGVSVDLASPATDFSGKAGLPGKVDSHFFKRFGSAMLLSVIGGLTTIASGGTSVILGGGTSAAAAAAQQDGQIGPTVRVRQGEPIRVFTARDLDFSRAPTL